MPPLKPPAFIEARPAEYHPAMRRMLVTAPLASLGERRMFHGLSQLWLKPKR